MYMNLTENPIDTVSIQGCKVYRELRPMADELGMSMDDIRLLTAMDRLAKSGQIDLNSWAVANFNWQILNNIAVY